MNCSSPCSWSKHVSHVLSKLSAASRTKAVARARELGLIPSPRPHPRPGGALVPQSHPRKIPLASTPSADALEQGRRLPFHAEPVLRRGTRVYRPGRPAGEGDDSETHPHRQDEQVARAPGSGSCRAARKTGVVRAKALAPSPSSQLIPHQLGALGGHD